MLYKAVETDSLLILKWFIDSELLKIEDSIPYLGSMLGDSKGKAHCESRIRATTRPYFALQGAG